MTATPKSGVRGFWSFYREYTHTGVHAAAAAGLTAFGLLSFVHRAFVVVAIAAYVVPPVYLYVASMRRDEADTVGLEWVDADASTDVTLRDVVVAGGAAFAVGDDGTIVASGRDGWEQAVDPGSDTASNTLRAAAATDDGRFAWVAGDGGALLRVDVNGGGFTDYSAPNGSTSTWEDVAAVGPAGQEMLFLVTGSGEVLRGEYRDDGVAWGAIRKPGSGTSITGVAFVDRGRGYLCDTNGTVFETADGGDSYESIGVENASAFTDIAAVAADDVDVTAQDGTVFRYDGVTWTGVRAGDAELRAVARAGDAGLTVAADGSIYDLVDGSWESASSPTRSELNGVACSHNIDVAVGATGTILEREH